jgi:LuxR family maltose regulon positive regulatory protein
LAEVPPPPREALRIEVLGPLRVWRGGQEVVDVDLRRQRVRQLLCYLVVHERVRRETVAEELWPDASDPGKNLRVTLTRLQRVLQPDRAQGEPSYFVRGDGIWLRLGRVDHLEVDTRELDGALDRAEEAERDQNPRAALAEYEAALPRWQGEPFADAPYDGWALAERTRLRLRYVAGALRAGELRLAGGSPADAAAAVERTIAADPTSEPAYLLLARAHLARSDGSGARQVVERCRRALAGLGLEPDAATLAVLD